MSLPANIARIFPHRPTSASPTDPLAFYNRIPSTMPPQVDTIHISCSFTWHKQRAEQLAGICELIGYKVNIGGPAYGTPAGEFVPGMYLKQGYTFTSRGCPNKCKHCLVPQRQGKLVELPITDGFNILDDNLLACSPEHIHKVFEMLSRQKERPIFTGGLEAKILQPWHVDLLREARTERLYCAYDEPNDFAPLVDAGKMLRDGGISKKSQKARAYVLVGYDGDTPEKADKRMRDTWHIAGFVPYAMYYRGMDYVKTPQEWRKFLVPWEIPQTRAKVLEEAV